MPNHCLACDNISSLRKLDAALSMGHHFLSIIPKVKVKGLFHEFLSGNELLVKLCFQKITFLRKY